MSKIFHQNRNTFSLNTFFWFVFDSFVCVVELFVSNSTAAHLQHQLRMIVEHVSPEHRSKIYTEILIYFVVSSAM